MLNYLFADLTRGLHHSRLIQRDTAGAPSWLSDKSVVIKLTCCSLEGMLAKITELKDILELVQRLWVELL